MPRPRKTAEAPKAEAPAKAPKAEVKPAKARKAKAAPAEAAKAEAKPAKAAKAPKAKAPAEAAPVAAEAPAPAAPEAPLTALPAPSRIPVTILPAGYLVEVVGSVETGVTYRKIEVVSRDAVNDGRGERERYISERVVRDAAEKKEAESLNGAAVNAIKALCVNTNRVGRWLYEDKLESFYEVRAEFEAKIDAFNCRARVCHIAFAADVNQIVASEAAAEYKAKQVTREIAYLLTKLDETVLSGDVDKIRRLVNRTQDFARVLGEADRQQIAGVVEEVREVASTLQKRVNKGKEALDAVLRDVAVANLTEARSRYLDLANDARPVEGTPLAPVVARDLDLDEAAPVAAPAEAERARNIDLSEPAPVAVPRAAAPVVDLDL